MRLPNIPKRNVYLDYAAATPADPAVVCAMIPFFTEQFENPSGLYSLGRCAAEAIEASRKRIASHLHCGESEIIFTSGGTESDNLALFGIAEAHENKGRHIITSSIEHHAILETATRLKKRGFEITELPVDEFGCVSPDVVIGALREDTILISIMYANNEIGTIQPIAEMCRALARWKKERNLSAFDAPFFHTDACQAAGVLSLDVKKFGIDLMSLNGSKMYGPKGVGLLYVKRGLRLQPQVVGGGQENRMRSGTENVPAIVGFAKAFDVAESIREEESKRISELRDYLWRGIQERVPKVVLNGHPSERLPNNLNISILDIEGEALLLYLDSYGIAVSTGSACTSTSLDPSHVILACGRPYEYAHGSVRFSLGRSTTREDIDHVLAVLPSVVDALRKMSPVKLTLDQKQNDLAAGGAFVADDKPHWMK